MRPMEVFPIPPAPMRAVGVRFSARPTIPSIMSPRPKQTLGAGGGDSPSMLGTNVSVSPTDNRGRRPGLDLGDSQYVIGVGGVRVSPTEGVWP